MQNLTKSQFWRGPEIPEKPEISRKTPKNPDFGWWTPFLRNMKNGKIILLQNDVNFLGGLKNREISGPGGPGPNFGPHPGFFRICAIWECPQFWGMVMTGRNMEH